MTPCPLLRRLARSDRGVALLEFALALPILLIVFAAIVEGGRTMWAYQTAIDGVRDATRYVGRIVPSNVCPSSLPSPATYNARLTLIVRSSISGTSVLPARVQLDPSAAQPVSVSFSCVTGAYRLASTPIATVSARVRIDYPFQGLFRLAGGGISPFITTTITDQSRVFGS